MITSLDLIEVGNHVEILQIVRLPYLRVDLGVPPLQPPLACNPSADTKRNDGRGERCPANSWCQNHERPTAGLVQAPQRTLNKSKGRFNPRLTLDYFPGTGVSSPLGMTVRARRDVAVESRLLCFGQTSIQPLVELFSD